MKNSKINKNIIHNASTHFSSQVRLFAMLRIRALSGLMPLAFLLLAMTLPQQSHAQFWKKIFGSHKKEHKQESKKDKEKEPGTEVTEHNLRKRIIPEFPPTQRKTRYRIDVLLPLEINKYIADDKAVFPKLPAEIVPIINFYEGMRLAAERLNAENIQIDLFIQDAGQDGRNVKKLLQDTTLLHSDLIIGFLQSEHLDGLAKLAAKKHINFISAFSPSDAEVSNNPYFIILQPTLGTHIKRLTAFSAKHYPGMRPIFIYADQTPVQKESRAFFEKALKNRDWDSLSYEQFIRNPGMLAKLADSSQTNVILVNLLSYKKAEKVLKALNSLSSSLKFAIFGMPTWKYIPRIAGSHSAYQQMDIFFSTPFYFDLQSAKGEALAEQYKKVFGGIPSDMAFRGYEALYWTAHLLQSYGTIFNTKISNSRMAPFTRFDIQPAWSPKNKFRFFENNNLYIFHYLNGNVTIIH